MAASDGNRKRGGLLDIFESRRLAYLFVFVIQIAIYGGFAAAHAVADGCAGVDRCAMMAARDTGGVVMLALAISVIGVGFVFDISQRGWRFIMGLFIRTVKEVEEDMRAEALEKGVQIGKEEGLSEGISIGREEGIAIGEARAMERLMANGSAQPDASGVTHGTEALDLQLFKMRCELWYAHKENAELRGEPFDEPPPWKD